jgi:hypothetical protein
MPEPDKPIQLGLSSEPKPAIQPIEYVPAPEDLQFRKAEHAAPAGAGPPCVVCKTRIVDTYYHAQGNVVCPNCALTIQSGQNAPPPHTLLISFLYGLGAAIAGTALFSFVWIVSKSPFALISILIGYMVGKAVRHASRGLGGRPQQIIAVLLTYFSVAMSIVPVVIYQQMEKHTSFNAPQLISLLFVGLISPFLALKAGGIGGILTLLITFFGIQRAWRLTGRTNILVMGPYQLGS